ncbi:hypothetical protein [Piscinibacter defluvii]|uniref:hypothetical protein n=1 Tax=Piscinibacter defluvii TaxID=1796922 RepID=UPI000FDE1EC2|nr:hypothetical protein [Piscinibacter defluvii]
MIRVLALVFAMGLLGDASACSCITRTTLKEQFEYADHVFVGRVLSKESVASREDPKGWPGVAAKVQLQEIVKAKYPPPTKLITGVGTGDCGVPIFPALSYVFFAGPGGEIDICSGTRPYISGNEEMERYLREVKSLAGQKSAP